MKSILEALNKKKILVSDGAWGTFLHQSGLQPGECPELWNITHRKDVYAIAESYINAGADIILTNSFGGSAFKLKHYSLHDRVFELNEAAAAISKEAAGEENYVLGSIGPTGVMLMMGEISEREVYEGFQIQAEALMKGGVDALCIETMSAVDEACIAIRAAKAATNLEVACTFTFELTTSGEYRTMMGVSPEEMVHSVIDSGADIIGANCGNGFDQMIDLVAEIRKVNSSIPILVHANAGKPIYSEGRTIFPDNPTYMGSKVYDLINCGANIIGGCCGTTPAHIKALAEQIKKIRQ